MHVPAQARVDLASLDQPDVPLLASLWPCSQSGCRIFLPLISEGHWSLLLIRIAQDGSDMCVLMAFQGEISCMQVGSSDFLRRFGAFSSHLGTFRLDSSPLRSTVEPSCLHMPPTF